MILGIGTDLCRIQRVRDALKRTGDPFVRKFFTPREIEAAVQTGDTATHLATRFAAKEAIFKAFGIGLSRFEGTDIEISAGELGEPSAILKGPMAAFAGEKGVTRLHISLSYDGEYATAVALLEGES